METIAIIMFVFAAIALIVGLLLSGSGTGAGLNNLVGQDLELFKKTKDHGIVKVLQIIMFLIMIIMIVLGITLMLV